MLLRRLKKVTQINPKEADAHFEIGRIWMQRKDRAKALAAFRKGSELDPRDADYKRAVAETSPPEEISVPAVTQEEREAELKQRHR